MGQEKEMPSECPVGKSDGCPMNHGYKNLSPDNLVSFIFPMSLVFHESYFYTKRLQRTSFHLLK